MIKIFYNESNQSILLRNPNVVKVSDRSISCQSDFKVRALISEGFGQ